MIMDVQMTDTNGICHEHFCCASLASRNLLMLLCELHQIVERFCARIYAPHGGKLSAPYISAFRRVHSQLITHGVTNRMA